MPEFRYNSYQAQLRSRNELIAAPQLVTLHLDDSLFHEEKPFIIIINGTANSGKSLVASAIGAQLMPFTTSTEDVIGEKTWKSSPQSPIDLKLHFIDAVEVTDSPMELLRGKTDAEYIEELKSKGDIIILQNVPSEFDRFGDLKFIVSGSPDSDEKMMSILRLSDRVNRGEFPSFFGNLDDSQIQAAATKIPDDYLKPDGREYEAVLAA